MASVGAASGVGDRAAGLGVLIAACVSAFQKVINSLPAQRVVNFICQVYFCWVRHFVCTYVFVHTFVPVIFALAANV